MIMKYLNEHRYPSSFNNYFALHISDKDYFIYSEMPSGAPEPPLFTERFQELTVPEKGTFKLVARVTGNPVPEVTWLR